MSKELLPYKRLALTTEFFSQPDGQRIEFDGKPYVIMGTESKEEGRTVLRAAPIRTAPPGRKAKNTTKNK